MLLLLATFNVLVTWIQKAPSTKLF